MANATEEIQHDGQQEGVHTAPPSHHNGLHKMVFFVLIFSIIAAQFALYQWKKHRYSAFRNVTLIGLWTIPLIMSIYSGFWRMVTLWTIFTIITGYIIKIAIKKPLQPKTPRRVYIWFYRIYQVCSNVTIVGYIFVMCDYIFAPSNKQAGHGFGQFGLLLVFYGVYFGVLGRDCSEMCADWMASIMGVRKMKSL